MARTALDAHALATLAPAIDVALQAHLERMTFAPNGRSPFNRDVLTRILSRVRTAPSHPDEERRFLLFVAPLVRQALLKQLSAGSTQAAQDTAHLDRWLERLNSFDPLSALMIDLHYFCGLSLRETAVAIQASPPMVVNDLRFARAWLAAYLARQQGMSKPI